MNIKRTIRFTYNNQECEITIKEVKDYYLATIFDMKTCKEHKVKIKHDTSYIPELDILMVLTKLITAQLLRLESLDKTIVKEDSKVC